MSFAILAWDEAWCETFVDAGRGMDDDQCATYSAQSYSPQVSSVCRRVPARDREHPCIIS
jgi:hypothetical protein